MPASLDTPADPALSLLGSFQAHYAALLRFLARRSDSRDDALEVAHETWLRLAEANGSGTGAGAVIEEPRAYLFAVAANLAVDRQRRASRVSRVLRVIDASDDDAAGWPDAPRSPDVAEQYAHRQALLAVEAALARLPERARACFLAHRLEGVGQEELALRHGVSVKTVERDVQLAMDGVCDAMERWRGAAPAAAGRHRGRGRRKALSAMLGVAALGGTTAVLWRQLRPAAPELQLALESRVGQRVEQQLPGGGRIVLDADSRVDVLIEGGRRQVRLRKGSVWLEFARAGGTAPEQPFLVEAAGCRLMGVAACLGLELDDEGLGIGVESGTARLETPDGAVSPLAAGDAAIWRDGRLSRRRLVDAADAAPWRSGWLEFQDLPLAAAVARLRRYGGRPIGVTADAGALRVTGRIRIAQAMDWLALLPRQLPVRLENAADGALLIRRR